MPLISDMVAAPKVNTVGEVEMFLARTNYDFAVDGGAVGDIALFGSAVIPKGAMVVGGYVHTITPLTSGGAATVALKVEGTADLQAATAYNAAPFVAAGYKKAGVCNFGTDPIVTTAARDITMTIAGAALTAGKFEVGVYYLAPGL